MRRRWTMILGIGLLASPANWPVAQARDFSTLYGKHIAGYQGWFGCPADGVGWFHWFRDDQPTASNLVVDMLPDISWAQPAVRCDTGMVSKDGQKVYVFSSKEGQVVREHFTWMRQYGLDGVAVQRFVSALSGSQLTFTNSVLSNIRQAAEAEDRGFFIMYDLSGSAPDVIRKVNQDWISLVKAGVPASKSYMHHNGRPLVGLWGAGLNDRGVTPSQVQELLQFFKAPESSATTVGGVPMYWRALGRDSSKNPAWSGVFRSFDVISPWSVGRLKNPTEVADFMRTDLVEDMREAARVGKDYLPVQYPGMSFTNATKGRISLNNIPRLCGEFYNSYGEALIKNGARMIYTAMFDEVNEGTAIFKVNISQQKSPDNAKLATLSDGSCLASNDMYLSIAGDLTRMLHSRNNRQQ